MSLPSDAELRAMYQANPLLFDSLRNQRTSNAANVNDKQPKKRKRQNDYNSSSINSSCNSSSNNNMDQELTLLFSNIKQINSKKWQREHLSDTFGSKWFTAGFIKEKVPLLNQNEISFFLNEYHDTKDDTNLLATIASNCWKTDIQQRKITGIVQAYGCGKTRAALQLSKNYVVLPIRFADKGSGLLKRLNQAQESLYTEFRHKFPDDKNIPIKEVEDFSNRCENTVHLLLLSLAYFCEYCVSNRIIDINSEQDRYNLALLMLLEPLVATWCENWFNNNFYSIYNGEQFNSLMEKAPHRFNKRSDDEDDGRKIIFLFDEVHVLFDLCRGYCMHKLYNQSKSGDLIVQEWLQEQNRKISASGHSLCTDFFINYD